MSGAGASSGMKADSEVKLSLSPCGHCGKETPQCCGHCRKESFCSVTCQKARRKQHKLICFPAKEEIGEGFRYGVRGNGLGSFWVATRDIEEGERIFTDYPLMTGPGQEETVPGQQICLGCHKILKDFDVDTDERKCGDCGWPLCGDACPGIERHLKECEGLSWMREAKSEFASLAKTACDQNGGVYISIRYIRLMALMKDDPIKWKSFLNLHVPDIVQNRMARLCDLDVNQFEIGFRFFKCALQLEFTKEVMVRLSAAEGLHRSRPYFPIDGRAEQVIYDKETWMDIRCMENCYVSKIPISKKMSDPHGIVFVAAKYIQKGERLCIPFGGNPSWDGTKRRRETQMKNGDIGFICKCARCFDPTELGTNVSAIKCTKCKSGLMLPLNPLDDNSKWNCNRVECSGLVPACDVSRVVNKIQKEADALTLIVESELFRITTTNDFAMIARVTNFVDKYEQILNPHHYILLNIQRLIMIPYTHTITKGNHHGKVRRDDPLCTEIFERINRHRKLARIFLDVASKIYPPFSLRTLEAHYYVGMSNFFSAQQAVGNKETIDVVLDWLKQGISHRQSFMESITKSSLQFPDNGEVYGIQMKCLGWVYENALELCRLTPNYREIPEKRLEFDPNFCTAEVPTEETITVEKN